MKKERARRIAKDGRVAEKKSQMQEILLSKILVRLRLVQ